jgi:hypothetical protein
MLLLNLTFTLKSTTEEDKKKLYDFTFPRVNYHFINSNIPASPVYGVKIKSNQSCIQSNPVKVLAVIEQRRHLRKKWKIHCHLRYGCFSSGQPDCDKKLYDFTFPRVNYHFINSNIPASPVYGVHISQRIRYSVSFTSNSFGWMRCRLSPNRELFSDRTSSI